MPAYLAIGPNMSVRFIEGVQGVGFACMSVIISPKKTVMYKAKTVEEIARFFVPNLEALSNGDVFLLNNQLKGESSAHPTLLAPLRTLLHDDAPRRTRDEDLRNLGGYAQADQVHHRQRGRQRDERLRLLPREVPPAQPLVSTLLQCSIALLPLSKDLPMVEVKKGNNVENFPMELCRICPGQRVRLEKMSTEMARQVLEVSRETGWGIALIEWPF